ncbi:NUDIX domain-containing protein [Patescibacteria group bacterium]|nr:NUDIX domain-containing protein [Patescibacteria group bacterium]MDE1946937.1 NUDIX domain-containing protein [Patescibacteria group bacterium]MDE2011198.1 NUDIX domain-containing protein [Patescibacteria group bacterium]MDE2233488.1 NUDIX domain-containing protein [Patescibacteria group bacterium]
MNIRHRATAVILKGRKVLMFHRIKPGHDYFVFPGGGIEPGETAEEAMKREIKEELDLDVKASKQLFSIENMDVPDWATIHTGQKQTHHYFLVEDFSGIPKLSGPEKERANDKNEYHIVWMDRSGLEKTENIFPKEGAQKLLNII